MATRIGGLAVEPRVRLAHFDGLCEHDPATGRRNPGGIACGGWWVETPTGRIEGHRVYGHGDGMTNNLAEYSSALDALRAVWRTGWRGPVLLRGDSKLVICQATGLWRCQSPTLAPLLAQLRAATTHFPGGVTFEWVPREQNERADALSRLAYESALREHAAGRTRSA